MAPFCSCPASLVSRKFFSVGPGCAKCFLFVALRWAPRPFGGARAKKKKKTPPRVFFFCSGPGKGRGRRSPVPARGQSKKKNTTQGVFFCCGPGERQGKEKPRWAPAREQSKKKNTTQGVFFLLLRPRGKTGEGEAPLGAGTGPEQKKTPWMVCFFWLWPRAGAQLGFSFPCLSPGPEQKKKKASPSLAFRRGRSKKKKTWVVVFFFALVPCRHGASPSPAFPRGRSQKKTPWVVFFFLLRPRADAHSLTAGLGGDASPSPGWCFFFCCGPARTGLVFLFFAVAPPGCSLTHCGLGRFRQGPGGVFFLLRPRRVFLDNNKKCLGYYIGSKKTRRGHSKKKNTTSLKGTLIVTLKRNPYSSP